MKFHFHMIERMGSKTRFEKKGKGIRKLPIDLWRNYVVNERKTITLVNRDIGA